MTDIQSISTVEQALHATAIQRQSTQSQLDEIEHAISELTGESTYKIIGSMMVKADPEKLKEELSIKKESLSATLTLIEQQEKKLREKMANLQKEAVK